MAYRVNGIECDTVEEVLALGAVFVGDVLSKKKPKKKNPIAAAGVQKSWDEARKLAKKEGISVQAARAKIAKSK